MLERSLESVRVVHDCANAFASIQDQNILGLNLPPFPTISPHACSLTARLRNRQLSPMSGGDLRVERVDGWTVGHLRKWDIRWGVLFLELRAFAGGYDLAGQYTR